MANYTAIDVKRLRGITASGMMVCEKALEETDGDLAGVAVIWFARFEGGQA